MNSIKDIWFIRLWQHVVSMWLSCAAVIGNVAPGGEATPGGTVTSDSAPTVMPGTEGAASAERAADVHLGGRNGFKGDRRSFRLLMWLWFALCLCVLVAIVVLLMLGMVTPEGVATMARAFLPFK